jgi:hypothetical protein
LAFRDGLQLTAAAAMAWEKITFNGFVGLDVVWVSGFPQLSPFLNFKASSSAARW